MKLIYADPPYPGNEHRYDGPGVFHPALINYLEDTADGWALSTGSNNLVYVLGLAPPGVRVGAWVKPRASFKRGVDPAYAWEPIVFQSARRWDKEQQTVRDWHMASATMKGFFGAKPPSFTWWIMDLLGYSDGDEFVDMFPGSGLVTEAANNYQMTML